MEIGLRNDICFSARCIAAPSATITSDRLATSYASESSRMYIPCQGRFY